MDNQQPTNAWTDAEQRYQVGQEVRGMVTRVTQLGVFVQVAVGIEGILYAFELGAEPAALAGFTVGQEIQLYVKSVDASRKRLELSLNNAPMPGLLNEQTRPMVHKKNQPDALSRQFPHKPGGDPHASNSACPTCQSAVQSVWKYCVYCGGSLQRRCPACGNTQPVLPGARYCYACGQPV